MEKLAERKLENFHEKKKQWKWVGIATVLLLIYVLWPPMVQLFGSVGFGKPADKVALVFANLLEARTGEANIVVNMQGFEGRGQIRYILAEDNGGAGLMEIAFTSPLNMGFWLEYDFGIGKEPSALMIMEISNMLGRSNAQRQWIYDTKRLEENPFKTIISDERAAGEWQKILTKNFRRLPWENVRTSYTLEMTGAEVQEWVRGIITEAKGNRVLRDDFADVRVEDVLIEDRLEKLDIRVIMLGDRVHSIFVTVITKEQEETEQDEVEQDEAEQAEVVQQGEKKQNEIRAQIIFTRVGEEIEIKTPEISEDAIKLGEGEMKGKALGDIISDFEAETAREIQREIERQVQQQEVDMQEFLRDLERRIQEDLRRMQGR
jgi:hypothetical protein